MCVRHAMRRTMRAIRYWLGQRVRRELTMRERAHAVIDWVWDSLGVCPIRFLHQKKYVFSGMLNFVGEPDRRYPHRVESRWLASSCQFPLMGLMPCPCGGAFFCLYCPTWIGGCK